MSDDVSADNAAQTSDDLASLLAKRGKKTRARSTSILIGVLLVLIGVLVGIGIGRASAPPRHRRPMSDPAVARSVAGLGTRWRRDWPASKESGI